MNIFDIIKKNKDKEMSTENIIKKDELDELVEFMKSNEVTYEFREKYIRKLVLKMSIWYELRFPEINSEDLYDTTTFFKSLSSDEKLCLKRPVYDKYARIDISKYSTNIYLSKNGKITNTYNFYSFGKNKLSGEDIVGTHAKDLLRYIKENNIELSKNNELEKVINEHDNSVYFKEELFRCVCYRLLKSNDSLNSINRCLLFINEFDVKINDVLFDKLISKNKIDFINNVLPSERVNLHIVVINNRTFNINNNKLINLFKEFNYNVKPYINEIDEYSILEDSLEINKVKQLKK